MNIVVTGGTKGIGKAIIQLFAAQGFDIITCARNAADLELLEKELKQSYPSMAFLGVPCDMGSKVMVKAFAQQIIEKFGTIDLLVNNAGVFLPGTIAEEDDGVFEQLMNLNIGGPYHLTRALLPNIRKAERSHIFNICSTASITAYTNGGSYCISKFALLGFSKVLREELKNTAIKVTSILPGATLTDSWAGTTIPENRFMPSEEIAQAVWNCYALKNAVVEEILIRPQLGDL